MLVYTWIRVGSGLLVTPHFTALPGMSLAQSSLVRIYYLPSVAQLLKVLRRTG